MINGTSYNRPLHWMAIFTALLTFFLICLGGLVTSHDAGMSVPDWPNTYGYNMFLFPPSRWVGGIFFEHTHRLLASFVGLCSIAMTIIAWMTEPRRWVRWLATAVLGMVIFQGVLGGLRVVLKQLDLAIVHACVAQAFFCLTAFTCIATSRWWLHAPDLTHMRTKLIPLAITCVVIVYSQLIVGAVMRHEKAGLAIPDLPLAYGRLLPPLNDDQLQAANHQLLHLIDSSPDGRDRDLPAHVTMFQIWIHFTHRIGALLVTASILALTGEIARNRRIYPAEIKWAAGILLVLLATQLSLGLLTVYLRKPADIASAHVACGALVLVTSFILSVGGLRLYAGATASEAQGSEEPADAFAESDALAV